MGERKTEQLYQNYVPKSPTYNPTSPDPATLPSSSSSSSETNCYMQPYLTVQQNNVDFIEAETHERLVNTVRYEGPDFTRPLDANKKSSSFKRIYGEEYRTLAEFDIEPQFKMIKLDHQQQHEVFGDDDPMMSVIHPSVRTPSPSYNDFNKAAETGNEKKYKGGRGREKAKEFLTAADEEGNEEGEEKEENGEDGEEENYEDDEDRDDRSRTKSIDDGIPDKHVNPTPTARHSSVFKLSLSDIPNMCPKCLSVRCYCNDLVK